MQQEEELYLQICEFCEAVVHLESSHTRVANKTDNDRDTIILLQRCGREGRGREGGKGRRGRVEGGSRVGGREV